MVHNAEKKNCVDSHGKPRKCVPTNRGN